MKTIHKYVIPFDGDLELPEGADILTVQTQHGVPQLWALIDDIVPFTTRRFKVLGTGHSAEEVDGIDYLGTFQLSGGSLIFHVFEVEN